MAARLTAVDQRVVALVFATAVGAYLPTARYGFVEDDRAVVAANWYRAQLADGPKR